MLNSVFSTAHAVLVRVSRSLLLLGLWTLMIANSTAAPTGTRPSAVVTTDQVRAELLLYAPDGLRADRAAWLGLQIDHRPGWHTYWLNPGDSGLPTTLQWQLPAGWSAGTIQWPVPHKLPIGPLMNHGYEGRLLLPVALTVSGPSPALGVTIRLRADWLVCKDVCIPEGGDFTLTLPAGSAEASRATARSMFEQAFARTPRNLTGAQAQAAATESGLQLEVRGLPAHWKGKPLEAFPEQAFLLAPAAVPEGEWLAAADGSATWRGVLPYAEGRQETPERMAFVVASRARPDTPSDATPEGLRFEVGIRGTWPTQADPSSPNAPSVAPPPPNPAGDGKVDVSDAGPTGLLASIVLALLGGALLNLMPCVFPVLSLKVFGFAQHAHDRRQLALGGAAYTLGVVVSFVALAGVLLALRASGAQLGWGFQLQSPGFVVALTCLFALMGFNLLGLFELSVVLPGSLASLQSRHPVVDHFLTGVLAVLVASPCTAPFMGASLGLAVTLPTHEALAVFAALGFGMALPYLALSLWPAGAARLPRPGLWMQHFKHAMALPMFATVVWLLWVLGHQTSIDALAAMVGFLTLLGFALWAWQLAWKRPVTQWVVRGAVVLSMAAAAQATAPLIHSEAEPARPSGSTDSAGGGTIPAAWSPWSPEEVQRLVGQGTPVFVDYTAAWCVTCQVNKRTTLNDAAVTAAFAKHGVVALRADWTRRDERITQELSRLRRSGVPVYALYTQPGQPPQILPEVLSPALVLQALQPLPVR